MLGGRGGGRGGGEGVCRCDALVTVTNCPPRSLTPARAEGTNRRHPNRRQALLSSDVSFVLLQGFASQFLNSTRKLYLNGTINSKQQLVGYER